MPSNYVLLRVFFCLFYFTIGVTLSEFHKEKNTIKSQSGAAFKGQPKKEKACISQWARDIVATLVFCWIYIAI